MNKFISKIAVALVGCAMAVGVGVAIGNNSDFKSAEAAEQTLVWTFESATAHRAAGGQNSYAAGPNTNYYEHGTSNDHDISLSYADSVTSGSPLNGSANVLARVAKNTTNSPIIILGDVNLNTYSITGFSYKASLGSNVSLAFSYSLNGGTSYTSVTGFTAGQNNTYSKTDIEDVTGTSTVRIKIQLSVASSTGSNRDSQIDDVTIIYDDGASDVYPTSISYSGSTSVIVASTLNLSTGIQYTNSGGQSVTVKNTTYSVQSGGEYIDLNTSTGVVTGKKSGNNIAVVRATAETASSTTTTDITLSVNPISASGLTLDEQYVVYGVKTTSPAYQVEMDGLSGSYGTASTITNETPSCTYRLQAKAGYYENSIAFKNGNNYLALNEAKSLTMKASIDVESSWIVTWDSGTNAATIVNAAYQTYSLQLNHNNNNPRFACYSSSQLAIKLYHFVEKDLEDFTIDSEIDVYINDTATISVTFDPADAADKTLTWVSGDDDIATVNSSGVVTGVAVGDVTITASKTIDEVLVERTCTVHVLNNVAAHEGDENDPFDVNDAVKVANGIFTKVKSGTAVNLANTYYVKGMVTKLQSGTVSNFYFWIGDNASQVSAVTGGFEVFKPNTVMTKTLEQRYGEDNNALKADFAVGHVIVACGTITLYSGTTPEFNAGGSVTYNNYIDACDYAEYFITAGGLSDNNLCEDTIYFWTEMGTEYDSLADETKALFEIATHGASETYDDPEEYTVEHCVARYDDALLKHTELRTNEFIGRFGQGKINGEFGAYAGVYQALTQESNNALLIIVSISIVSLTAVGGYFFIRRRKER